MINGYEVVVRVADDTGLVRSMAEQYVHEIVETDETVEFIFYDAEDCILFYIDIRAYVSWCKIDLVRIEAEKMCDA